MTEPGLVTIAQFTMEHEARVAAAELEDAGIQSVLSDAEAGMMFGTYIGTAFGGVRLQVRECDVPIAHQLLAEFHQADNAAWHCDECGTDVEAGYAVCWNCGAAQPTETEAIHRQQSSDGPVNASGLCDKIPPHEPEPDIDAQIAANDEEARKAFKTAVFSVIFLPIILLAVPQVLRVSVLELSPVGNRRFFAAFFISVLVVLIWFAVFRMFQP